MSKKPTCPFCGRQLRYDRYDSGDWYLYCSWCGAGGPQSVTKPGARKLTIPVLDQIACNAEIAEAAVEVTRAILVLGVANIGGSPSVRARVTAARATLAALTIKAIEAAEDEPKHE